MTKHKPSRRKPTKRKAQPPSVQQASAQLAPVQAIRRQHAHAQLAGAHQHLVIALRKDIDSLDAKIAMLIKKRTIIAARIIALKTAEGEPIIDLKRERKILKRYANKLARPIATNQVKTLVMAIIQLTPRYRA